MSTQVLEQVIVGAIVGLAAVYLAVRAYRSVFRKDHGCGTCSDCPSRSKCEDTLSGRIEEATKRACNRHE